MTIAHTNMSVLAALCNEASLNPVQRAWARFVRGVRK